LLEGMGMKTKLHAKYIQLNCMYREEGAAVRDSERGSEVCQCN